GRGGRGRRGGEEPARRRARRGAVSDRLRQLLLLRQGPLFPVRELQSERVDGGEALGLLALRHLRLFASPRRLRRRAGGIRARALRGRRAAQGAGGTAR